MSDDEVKYTIKGLEIDEDAECDRLHLWFMELGINYEGSFAAWHFEAIELDPVYVDFLIILYGIRSDSVLTSDRIEDIVPASTLDPVTRSHFFFEDREYHAWLQIIYRKDRAGCIEALWDPIIRRWAIDIKGIEEILPCERVETTKLLAEGLPLVDISLSYSRTRGDMVSIDVFRERAKIAVRAMAKAKTPLTKKSLAKQVELDRNTIKKYLDRDSELMTSLHVLYQTELNG